MQQLVSYGAELFPVSLLMFSVSLLHQSSPPHNIHIKEEEEERLGAGERQRLTPPISPDQTHLRNMFTLFAG